MIGEFYLFQTFLNVSDCILMIDVAYQMIDGSLNIFGCIEMSEIANKLTDINLFVVGYI